MASAAGLKDATYENVVIPEDFGPIELVIDDHFVKRYAFTVDDYNPWTFTDENPFGRRIGQAAVLADDVLKVFFAAFDHDTVVGLHVEEQLWFDNPVFVGERATLSGRYVDKYIKRGDGHVVLEARAVGEDGRSLIRHRGIEIMRISDGHGAGGGRAPRSDAHVKGEYDRSLADVSTARLDLPPGTPLASLVKRVAQEQISVFTARGTAHRGLHNDLEIARRAGLPTPIAQGQMQACYTAQLLGTFFGARFYTTGWLRLKFLNPVFPADVLTVHGAVTGAHGGRLQLEVWITNKTGRLTAAGWASAEAERLL
jgi:acyl dehydratase